MHVHLRRNTWSFIKFNGFDIYILFYMSSFSYRTIPVRCTLCDCEVLKMGSRHSDIIFYGVWYWVRERTSAYRYPYSNLSLVFDFIIFTNLHRS